MNLTTLVAALMPLVVLAVLFAALKVLLPLLKKPIGTPYEPAGKLLSPAELSFLGVLKQALGDGYSIMCKVRLADVVNVKKGLGRADWQQAFNRIQSKHLDFVVCDPNDSTVLMAVELDDQSHGQAKRQERDSFVEDVLRVAGVPLRRFTVKRGYSVEDVRAALTAGDEPQADVPAAVPDAAPKCPKCGAVMVRRVAKSGANAGNEFWGCPNYPKCKGIVG